MYITTLPFKPREYKVKLVEILARELKEWPATTACFAQDDSDGDIYNYVTTRIERINGDWVGVGDEGMDQSCDCPEVYGQELASDRDTAIVTREMWEKERAKLYAWKGEGIPPVGTVCEYKLSEYDWWFKCEIKYVLEAQSNGCGSFVAWCHHLETDQYLSFGSKSYSLSLRPIKTPEQIEAEKRKEALDTMRSIVMGSSLNHGLLESLYDAGYRRIVQPK